MKSIDLLKTWLHEVETDPTLIECMVEYAKGRGRLSMLEICWGFDMRYRLMAWDQDEIGWRRFMEGMVASGLREIQTDFSRTEGSRMSPTQWSVGIIIKLMEVTHGQWLYRCIQVHDRIQGTRATLRKEELQRQIEEEQDRGYEGLLEEDQFLAEVNLDDLEATSGER